MIIREAAKEDGKWILHHRVSMFKSMGESEVFLTEVQQLTERYVQGDWTKEYRYFLLEEEGKTVGGCGLSTFKVPPTSIKQAGLYGYLSNMFIEPEYRKRGLGRSLLRHVLDICRNESIGLVILHASKEGHPLFNIEGFRSIPALMHLITANRGS